MSCSDSPDATKDSDSKIETPAYAIVIHGGAGTIMKENITDEQEAAYRSTLDSALEVGRTILADGGAAIEAVEAAIVLMEESPLFNAGRGAVFTHDGKNELDASIMSGHDLSAGAVAGVSQIKHPIRAARAVMEKSEHVMMSGTGAENFAEKNDIELVDPSYFYTEHRWNSLQRIKDSEATELDHDDNKHGTVGAVALDMEGNIVAGTSTGGMTNKRFGRIGDSPIIGAGTYADNITAGISCTGHGEYFIRHAVAYNVCSQMKYGNKDLHAAARHVIHDELSPAGGTGGLIGLDRNANIVMEFNTAGMYRGYATDSEKYIGIYK